MTNIEITVNGHDVNHALIGLSISHEARWSCQIRLGVLGVIEDYNAYHMALVDAVKSGFFGLIVGTPTSFQHFSLSLPKPDDYTGLPDENSSELKAVVTIRYHSAPPGEYYSNPLMSAIGKDTE